MPRRKKGRGWYGEPRRHSIASKKGWKTRRRRKGGRGRRRK